MRAAMEFSSPVLEDLVPDLSREEQLRLQKQFCDHERIWKRNNKSPPLLSPRCWERSRDAFISPHVHNALRHYNARHPGAEFDAVKPLMQCRVGFRDQVWFHLNFWARRRSSSSGSKVIIKRFFAEVHYKPAAASAAAAVPPLSQVVIPIVEVCTIIEEPLSQYRSSCAFCPADSTFCTPRAPRNSYVETTRTG
ncbi:hypothetical protein PVAP13_4KG008800 [Panicum virgatum]|uniref:DUF3615 domain-containing protein n=1 Tax=Panicum virgatum TaxID=38727 RepID=A0A8T0TLR7_PANVG|nr:hypothetical protein PVAP13_4KG008800 [Panicum virgatum]